MASLEQLQTMAQMRQNSMAAQRANRLMERQEQSWQQEDQSTALYKQAAADAAQLYQAGRPDEARARLMMVDKDLASKLLTDLDAQLQGDLASATGQGNEIEEILGPDGKSTQKVIVDKRTGKQMPVGPGYALLTAEAKQPRSKFQDALDTERGKTFAKVQDGAIQADEQIDLIDDAFNSLIEYKKSSPGGTGPLATIGGLTKSFSQKTENLNAKFKLINVKNMAQTFAGMSKAIDSDAERRAWASTQADISNDDTTNGGILLGSKSLALKARAEADAQKRYVEMYGELDEGYQSPIIGKTKTVIDRNGKMIIIPKEEYKSALKKGYMDLDPYVKHIMGKSGKQTITPEQAREELKRRQGKQ